RQGETSQAGECDQQGQDSPAPPVTGSCLGRPVRGPGARCMHTRDGATPVSPVCPAKVTTVSQQARAFCDTAATIPGPVHDIGAAWSGQQYQPFAARRA